MHSLSKLASALLLQSIAGVALFIGGSRTFAEDHTGGVPVLNSRPGAAYTLYVDFSGFNYVGAWNGTDTTDSDGHPTGNKVPGFTPSYNDVSPTGTFTSDEQTAIKTVWTRLAQSYSSLDINITTVDPAVAAGQAATDTARRIYYDATPNMMHMVIGSSARAEYVNTSVPKDDPAYNADGNWLPGADGVSPGLGIAAGRVDGPNALAGQHTSFMFSQGHADNGGVITNVNAEYVGGIAAHENAHSMGLNHQGDYKTGAVDDHGVPNDHINEYSFGDDNPDRIFAKPGTYVPIIGDANFNQRIAWRIGTDDETEDGVHYKQENDLSRIIQKSSAAYASAQGRTGGVDIHFIEDGKGHSMAAATQLALNGSTVDFTKSKGVIVPKSEINPLAKDIIGQPSNYTQDWYSFVMTSAGNVSLTVHDSTDFLTPGVADSDGTLRSVLAIFDDQGHQIGSGTEDISTMFETYSDLLNVGTYYAAISSYGGHDQINARRL